MSDIRIAAIAARLTDRAAAALRAARPVDGDMMVEGYTIPPVLIAHRVNGRGDALNATGRAVLALMRSQDGAQ